MNAGRLILVRHSIPEEQPGIAAAEWPLSEAGREAAGELAVQLEGFSPARLYTSPEPKAAETAAIIGARLRISPAIVPALSEHRRSDASYLARREFEATVAAFFLSCDELVFGDETADAADQRFRITIEEISREEHGTTPIMVSHGRIISLFLSRRTGTAALPIWRSIGAPSAVIVTSDWRIEAIWGAVRS
jgi:broad specificity phosphatase PhoE